jgi:Glycine-zipper domain
MKKFLLFVALALPIAACADMTPTQQRALTGTAAGAGVGAVIGAIGGNAGLGAGIGAGAGLLGGLLVDQSRRSQDAAFRQGYVAGRRHAPPRPPRS